MRNTTYRRAFGVASSLVSIILCRRYKGQAGFKIQNLRIRFHTDLSIELPAFLYRQPGGENLSLHFSFRRNLDEIMSPEASFNFSTNNDFLSDDPPALVAIRIKTSNPITGTSRFRVLKLWCGITMMVTEVNSRFCIGVCRYLPQSNIPFRLQT